MRKVLERIGFRAAFCLYLIAVVFCLLQYNNGGLDAGVPGYLAWLQLEWFGSAEERITIWAAVAVFLVPFFIVAAMVAALPPRIARCCPTAWPGNLLSAAAIVATLTVSAHFFLTDAIVRTAPQKSTS
jgi:hypothetical protein